MGTSIDLSHSLDQLPTVADVDQIELDDGTVLDARQSLACVLKVTTDLSTEQIAEAAGYCDRSAASKFLNSDKGKKGREACLTQAIRAGGEVGFRAALHLARHSKSDKVRLDAAFGLMDRAGRVAPKPQEAGRKGTGEGSSTVVVNIGKSDGDTETVTIEHRDDS